MLLAARLTAAVLAASLCLTAEPIRLDPKNPHYFLFRGKVVALITSGEHYGAVMNADFDYHRYLATLETEGMNYTRLFGGSYREVPAQSFGILRNTLAPAPTRYLAPWARNGEKFDLDHWNPDYFTHYRDFLSEAARHGIVVEVTLFSSHYQEMHWKISPFNPGNNVNATPAIEWKKLHTLENGNILTYQERYARQLVREAASFDNVIFEIQNEPWSDRPALSAVVNPYLALPGRDQYPNSVDLADPASRAWQTRVAGWISSEESGLPQPHLIAQNYCNFRFPVRDLVPGVSIVNFHYAYPEAVTANYGLRQAIAYDETGFLGHDDGAYRRQAWNFMLAGGSAFDALDYSFSVGHEDGSDAEPNGPGGGSITFRRQLRILSDFLSQLPLEDLAPDTRVVQHAGGAVAHALSSPRGDYAVYFDGPGLAVALLDLPAGSYSYEWVNTETGKAEQKQVFAIDVRMTVPLKPPAYRDGIALRLRLAR
ncbi:MAG: hypothetical protein ABSH50_27820 [Bryobacteraceae bacterium]|jgi:hypothetical protein